MLHAMVAGAALLNVNGLVADEHMLQSVTAISYDRQQQTRGI